MQSTVYVVSYAYDDFSSTGLSTIAMFDNHAAAIAYAHAYIATCAERNKPAPPMPIYDATHAPIKTAFLDAICIEAHTIYASADDAPKGG